VVRHLPRGLLVVALAVGLAACTTTHRAPAPEPRDTAPPVAGTPGPAQPPVRPPARPAPGRGAYYQDDGPGDNPPPNLESTPDAVPRDEPPLRTAANRPYVVFGRTYTPLTAAADFRQRGVGSWYGRKFHGQKTSSGEPYDMYAMTAAHPTLPLPSWVRVTNLENGRSVVVKVNDRGPFHAERVIDLSFTAALKLGYANQGSARVEIERVRPGTELARSEPVRPPAAPPATTSAPAASSAPAVAQASRPAAAPPAESGVGAAAGDVPARDAGGPPAVLAASVQPDGVYLQLGAFGAREGAEEFRIKTYQQLPWLTETLYIVARDRLHRVQLGPYKDRPAAQAVANRIREALQLAPMFVVR
jgi:rare lipoprotein A